MGPIYLRKAISIEAALVQDREVPRRGRGGKPCSAISKHIFYSNYVDSLVNVWKQVDPGNGQAAFSRQQ